MPSKTSLFSRGFLNNDFRKYSWVAYVYTLLLFFTIPLQILMQVSNENISQEAYENIFLLVNQGIQALTIVIVPVVLGTVLFQYLHSKEAADTLHSLPVQRNTLYRTHVLIGIILLVLPLLITSVLSILINLFLNLGDYYTIVDVIRWTCYISLLSVSIFLVCVGVGMLTGISAAQGVLSYILLIFPAGILVLILETLSYLIYGFHHTANSSLIFFSPFTRIIEGFSPLKDRAMGGVEIIAYLVLCIGIFFLANYLYKIRNLENAGQTIIFPKLRILFKYGFTLCTMIIGGLYFNSAQQTLSWTIFGYFVGSLLGYLIAEIVLNRSLCFFRDIKSMKGYFIFASIIIVCLLCIKADFLGFEKRQPNLIEVDKIFFYSGFLNSPQEIERWSLTEQNNIESIYRLHQEIIQTKSDNYFKKKQAYQNNSVAFIYQLENGGTMSRGYTINYDNYAQFLKPIYESEEYKHKLYEILSIDPADVEKVTISPNMPTPSSEGVNILDPEEIKSMLDVMKQDALARTYEQMQSKHTSWASVSLLIANNKTFKYRSLAESAKYNIYYDHHIYSDWLKTDSGLENWLKEKNHYAQARIFPEDISFIVVEKINNRDEFNFLTNRQYRGETALLTEQKGIRMIIRDKSQIETCLQEYIDEWHLTEYNSGYFIRFYGEDNFHYGSGAFQVSNAPKFIKTFFAQ